MNTKLLAVVAIAGVVFTGSLFVAHAQSESPKASPLDPRIDKLLEQNEKILKNQDDIIKKLEDLQKGVLQLRVRSS